jgi:2'-5' RNA ligase
MAMNENIQTLAKEIEAKLKEAKLISDKDSKFANKLGLGNLKDTDWKVALEEVITQQEQDEVKENEAE